MAHAPPGLINGLEEIKREDVSKWDQKNKKMQNGYKRHWVIDSHPDLAPQTQTQPILTSTGIFEYVFR